MVTESSVVYLFGFIPVNLTPTDGGSFMSFGPETIIDNSNDGSRGKHNHIPDQRKHNNKIFIHTK